MTNGHEYSGMKVFHHQASIEELRGGGQPDPPHVQLVITNRCNNRCSWCAYRLDGYTSNQSFSRTDEIPAYKANTIIDDLQTMDVKALQFTGGGEPTVHSDHEKIIGRAISNGFDVSLVTNGNNVSNNLIGLLRQSAWVRVSLDAATADVYSSMRNVGVQQFKVAVHNIERMVAAAESSSLIVGIGFVVSKENYRQVYQATQLAKELGVHNIRISAVFQSDGAEYFRGFLHGVLDQCRRARELETTTFRVFDNFGDRIDDLEITHPRHKFCGAQHFTTYIGADLNVYRCCVLAYNSRGYIGSLEDQSLSELWDSDSKRVAFNRFDARGCPRCMFNAKNDLIRYAIEKDPPHVNFV